MGCTAKTRGSLRCESPPAEPPKRQVGCEPHSLNGADASPFLLLEYITCGHNPLRLLTHAMFSACWLWRLLDLWASLIYSSFLFCKICFKCNSILGGVGALCDEALLCSWNNACLALTVLQCKSVQCLRQTLFKVSTIMVLFLRKRFLIFYPSL